MQSFKITFGSGHAHIATAFFIRGEWKKKTLLAKDAKSLWAGLEALTSIAGLPSDKLVEAVNEISKVAERALLEEAIPSWLLAGNKIKVVKPAMGKLSMDSNEQAAILSALGDLDLLSAGLDEAASNHSLPECEAPSGEATLIDSAFGKEESEASNEA